MRKVIMTVIQMVIFIAAWYLIANRIEANTYFGSVSYNVDVMAESIRWILLGAACLSVVNILVWWPRTQKVTNTQSEKPIIDKTKSEAKDEDPKTPDLS